MSTHLDLAVKTTRRLEQTYQPIFITFPSIDEFATKVMVSSHEADILTYLCDERLDLLNHAAHWIINGMEYTQVRALVTWL